MSGDSAYNLDGPAFPTNHPHDLDGETMTEANHSSRKFYGGMLRVLGCLATHSNMKGCFKQRRHLTAYVKDNFAMNQPCVNRFGSPDSEAGNRTMIGETVDCNEATLVN